MTDTALGELLTSFSQTDDIEFTTTRRDHSATVTDVSDDGDSITVRARGGGSTHILSATRVTGDSGDSWDVDPVRTANGYTEGELLSLSLDRPDQDMKTADLEEDPDDENDGSSDGLTASVAGDVTAAVKLSPLEQRKQDRDERVDDRSVSKLRAALKKTGLVDEVREVVQQLTNRREDVLHAHGGRLDPRQTVRLLSGDASVQAHLYEDQELIDHGDRMVGVALDTSGSMRNDIREASLATAAIGLACEAVGDTFVAVEFPGSGQQSALITGPTEPHRTCHLAATSVTGGTPMRAGIRDLMRLSKASHASTKLMLVVTDGKPSRVDECEELIQVADRQGLHSLGIGIGSARMRSLEEIFGDDRALDTGVDDLAETFFSAYRRVVA